jgi:hypothetical protein
MRFADGTIAGGPIATCEIQGYVYDAKLRTARLAREFWNDAELAARLERQATKLAQRFDRDFWLPERAHYALALDGDKRPVDSLASTSATCSGAASSPRRRPRRSHACPDLRVHAPTTATGTRDGRRSRRSGRTCAITRAIRTDWELD